jgi:RNA polymerase sigma factor (sigma-70 family)
MANRTLNDVVERLRNAVLPSHYMTSDAELVAAFLERRDQAALTALIHRHAAMVWGVCRRLLRDHHDAEDAFQATFLVLVRKAATIRRTDCVAPWLHGVAQQTARKTRAILARRRLHERQMESPPEPVFTEEQTRQDLSAVLDREVSFLPGTFRAVIVLCDLQGRTRQEAARELGWPEGTVAGRLARARARLAKQLARRGLAALSSVALAALATRDASSAAVPSAALTETINAATLVGAGQAAAASGISAQVAAITEGVLKSMALTKIKIANLMFAVGVCASLVAGGLFYRAYAAPPAAKAQDDNDKETANAEKASPEDDKKPAEPKSGEGELHGLVYLASQPLTTGKVVLVGVDAKTYEAVLDAKGGYAVNEGKPIPIGTYKVGILSDNPLMRKKYADPKTSGLSATVTKANTPASWNLKTSKDEGKLFGLVRVDEKVLIGGKIILYDTDGTTYEGPLDARGDYRINDSRPIPSDTYKVAIISDDPLLPKKYADVKTSGLTVTVTSQGIPHSWNLTSVKP